MKKTAYNLGWISRYRDEWFGIAIISIMIFHYLANVMGAVDQGIALGRHPEILAVVVWIQDYIHSIGVEVFVFLSGMGLYFSFHHNSSLGRFYKKRYTRILIPYFIVGGIFWIMKDVWLLDKGWLQVLKDLLFVTFVTDGVRTLWFIGMMIVLYALFPWIYKAMNFKYRLPGALILLFLSYFLVNWLRLADHEHFSNLSIFLLRIPLFVLGCYLGKYIMEEKRLHPLAAAVIIVCAFATKFYVVNTDMSGYIDRWLDGFYAVGIILAVTVVLHLLRQAKHLRAVLRWFGKYSLELYMTHVTIRNLMGVWQLPRYEWKMFLVEVILAIILSPLLHRFCSWILPAGRRKRAAEN